MTGSQTERVSQGDRVRVDIPDESNPDHDRHHGRHGEVIAVLTDSGTEVLELTYRVEFDDGGYEDFPQWHLRPPITG